MIGQSIYGLSEHSGISKRTDELDFFYCVNIVLKANRGRDFCVMGQSTYGLSKRDGGVWRGS